MDPATTIGVALRHFDLVGREAHSIPKDAKPIRILLAQMDRGKAETLAGNLADVTIGARQVAGGPGATRLNFDVGFCSAADFSAGPANHPAPFHLPHPVKTPPQESEKTPPRAGL